MTHLDSLLYQRNKRLLTGTPYLRHLTYVHHLRVGVATMNSDL